MQALRNSRSWCLYKGVILQLQFMSCTPFIFNCRISFLLTSLLQWKLHANFVIVLHRLQCTRAI